MKKIVVLSFFFFMYYFANAQTWFRAGNGLTNPVFAMDTASGVLYTNGDTWCDTSSIHSCVAFVTGWNGAYWDTLTGMGGVEPSIQAITDYQNKPCFAVYQYGIMQWNDSVILLGGFNFNEGASVLYSSGNSLYIGGQFAQIGGVSAKNIAVWNGAKWDSLGSGINGIVYALTMYKGKLIAGGSFTLAGGVPVKNIATWNGTAWDSIGRGIDSTVRALCVYNGNLYAGGDFVSVSHQPINHIAKWNDTVWSSIGGGMNGSVYTFTEYQGDLIAGGDFDSASGTPANGISQWNGSLWDSVGGGMSGFGCGGRVNTLTVYKGLIFAGGCFDTAGRTAANQIAFWCSTCLVGINELHDNISVKLYPNPSSNGLFILDASSLRRTKQSQLDIYNMLGEKVYSTQFNTTATQIDLIGRPAGVYLYRVVNENGEAVTNGKLIIQ